MKRRTILTLGALATTAAIGAVGLPALAQGWGPQHMMQIMHGSQDGWGPQRMQGQRGFMGGPGTMRGPCGHGPMGAITDHAIFRSFDADADGTVSAEELESGLAGLHEEYDADGNGSLSAEEFEALFAEATRGFAERPFTVLDADRDGEISAEEMAFPAQMVTRMDLMHVNAADGVNQ
mgnify:CR=1 FL=1